MTCFVFVLVFAAALIHSPCPVVWITSRAASIYKEPGPVWHLLETSARLLSMAHVGMCGRRREKEPFFGAAQALHVEWL